MFKFFGMEFGRVQNDIQLPDSYSIRTGSSIIQGGGYSEKNRTIRSDYENAFAPVSFVVDEAIGRNIHLADPKDLTKDVTSSTALWHALTHPNDRMGWMQLLGVMISGFMSMPEISLLLWHLSPVNKTVPGAPPGGFTIDTIAGFTVLPSACRSFDADGCEVWRVHGKNGGEFRRDSVITLPYSLLPTDGMTGVSPGSASSQEAAIRDALNQHERGFFANGATPSAICTITARTNDEFEAIRDSYERSNRGPGKQGGMVYQRVIDAGMGQGMPSPTISIEPIGAVNDTLAINDIVAFTSTTISANYGISPIMSGDATTTSYQNQQIVEKKSASRVQAVLVRLFSTFEQELERVTESVLPFKFAWDSPQIDVADEQKVVADTRISNVKAMADLVSLGATSDEAATTLGLGEEWMGLDLQPPVNQTFQLNLTPGEPPKEARLDSSMQEELQAVRDLIEQGNAKKDRVAKRQPDAITQVRELLYDIAEDHKNAALGFVGNDLSAQDQAYADQLIAILNDLADKGGVTAARQLASQIQGFKVGRDYEMSERAFAAIKVRAEGVIENYAEFLDEQIAKAKQEDPDNWTALFEASLAVGFVGSRVNEITTMETKHAFQSGQLDNATNIQGEWRTKEPQAKIVKTWHATGSDPCVFCAAVDGTEAGVEDTFTPDDLIHAEDADGEDVTVVLDTDYSDGTLPDAHVNCQCTFGFTAKVG